MIRTMLRLGFAPRRGSQHPLGSLLLPDVSLCLARVLGCLLSIALRASAVAGLA